MMLRLGIPNSKKDDAPSPLMRFLAADAKKKLMKTNNSLLREWQRYVAALEAVEQGREPPPIPVTTVQTIEKPAPEYKRKISPRENV